MAKVTLKLNGRNITSSSQLKRELTKSIGSEIESNLKKAAGPGVRLKKTTAGFVAEGSPEAIERMRKKLI